jgi:hypothetical protein
LKDVGEAEMESYTWRCIGRSTIHEGLSGDDVMKINPSLLEGPELRKTR